MRFDCTDLDHMLTRLTVPAPLYEQLGVGLMGAG